MTGDHEARRRRLGRLIHQRRVDLGLSITAAAGRAGLNPKTWGWLESGARATRETAWAAIERALRWAPGSVATVLAGGDPTPHPDPHHDLTTGETYTDPAEQALWDLNLPPDTRRALIAYLRAYRSLDHRQVG